MPLGQARPLGLFREFNGTFLNSGRTVVDDNGIYLA